MKVKQQRVVATGVAMTRRTTAIATRSSTRLPSAKPTTGVGRNLLRTRYTSYAFSVVFSLSLIIFAHRFFLETTTVINDMQTAAISPAESKQANNGEPPNLPSVPINPLPLFFGIGQGTTGTNSMYESTCRLNLTSVHGNAVCVDAQTHPDVRSHDIHGIIAHTYALKYYKKLRDCATAKEGSCTFEDAVYYVREIKRWIRQVIVSGIGAVHDTPYTFMAKYVFEVAAKERMKHSVSSLPPTIVITSERDPTRWASRRAETHPIAIVCRHFFTYDHQVKYEELTSDAFDLNQCIDLTYQRAKTTKAALPTRLDEVFVSYGKLLEEANGNETKHEQLRTFNRLAIEHYQQSMHKWHSILYSVDLFDLQQRMDGVAIAQEIAKNIKTQLPQGVQDLLADNGVHLLEQKIKSRSARGMFHPFIKGLVKKNQSYVQKVSAEAFYE